MARGTVAIDGSRYRAALKLSRPDPLWPQTGAVRRPG